jgi:hypothetical protein
MSNAYDMAVRLGDLLAEMQRVEQAGMVQQLSMAKKLAPRVKKEIELARSVLFDIYGAELARRSDGKFILTGREGFTWRVQL